MSIAALRAFIKAAAPSEFAPGIPSKTTTHPIPKVEKPTQWEFGIHAHKAERAGPHLDLRLGDPETGHAHSWALREWPKPGESTYIARQPTHTIGYMDFKGRIESGYGKGDVDLARRDKTEVVHADADHVRFNVYAGRDVEEYLVKKTAKGDWFIKNLTASREVGKLKELPSSKPHYKVKEPEQVNPKDENTVLQAKIDGAHVLTQFGHTGGLAKVFSYRPTEHTTGVINHTYRIPDFQEKRTPKELQDTILRGEITAVDAKGKALPPERVGGILNAGVWKSREKQEQEGKLVPFVFDVVKWRGKDVSNEPFSKKLELLRQAVKAAPWLQIPRTAETPEEKAKLIHDIEHRKEPTTVEGVVEWRKDKPLPSKAKFRDEQDVYVRGVFQEQAKTHGRQAMAGGFEYSLAPHGPVVGRVGTGMSHSLKKDLLDNPDRYKGLQARIKLQRGYPGRAPAFQGWHLDEVLPEGAKLAAQVGR